jgi:hypothetical protein
MEISLAGLLGAVLGTMLAAVIYGPLVAAMERRLRNPSQSQPQDRATLAQEVGLLRRGVLAADLLLCAGIGYWIGQRLAG